MMSASSTTQAQRLKAGHTVAGSVEKRGIERARSGGARCGSRSRYGHFDVAAGRTAYALQRASARPRWRGADEPGEGSSDQACARHFVVVHSSEADAEAKRGRRDDNSDRGSDAGQASRHHAEASDLQGGARHNSAGTGRWSSRSPQRGQRSTSRPVISQRCSVHLVAVVVVVAVVALAFGVVLGSRCSHAARRAPSAAPAYRP